MIDGYRWFSGDEHVKTIPAVTWLEIWSSVLKTRKPY